MLPPIRFALLLVACFAINVAAQTYTSCDPLNKTCPADTALGTTASWNFSGSVIADDKIWNTTAGTIVWGEDGAEFTISEKGDSPTLESNFYIFWGRVSVIMKAASGTGIVSSVVLLSDDLDEIDWEFIGGNDSTSETNYFGKDNTTSYDRAIWFPVDDTQDTWHNYTTVWTVENTTWYIDSVAVRTLNFSDALDGYNYPQTPMTVRMGIWAGGDPTENSEGTVEWAGGDVNYTKGPFTMTVQGLEVEDYSHGKSYTYENKSGSWESIKIATGNSTIAERLTKTHGVEKEFEALSKTAKIAIAASVAGTVAVLFALLTTCCIKSRRTGRRERALADATWEKELTDVRSYKRMIASEEELHSPTRGALI